MSDIIESVPEQPTGSTSTAPATPPAVTPDRPRSGFARQKIKIQRLSDLYDRLLADHEELLLSYSKLEAEYHQLEEAFNEITALNESLARDLRQAQHHRPAPVRFGDLMGMMR
jgi:hypothetical protein